MSEASATQPPARSAFPAILLDAVVLALAAFGVYANAYEHEFLLDSLHTVRDNPAIRDLGNVPAFFTDLDTASTLRSNADYRPVLMISYALNHAFAGSAMPSWHATQIALHLGCAVGAYLLVWRLGREHLRARVLRWTALATALLFVLHPTASGVVCYLSARSSLLAAFFGLAAALTHAGPWVGRSGAVRGTVAVLAYTLALFTKVEAVAWLAVFVLLDTLEHTRVAGRQAFFLADLFAGWRTKLARLVPYLAATGVYFYARGVVMADSPFAQTSQSGDVSRVEYLLTQTTAWWSYVAHWFWPLGLVADDTTFPVRRSLTEPAVLAAVAGWLVVVALCLGSWRRRPYVLVACASGLALISPTSSIVPLAEMVNEHRPYLPVLVLSCAWMLAASELGERFPRWRSFGLVALGAAVLACWMLTWQRNTVFATEHSYWADVRAKAPSARAHANYARTLMARRAYAEAVQELETALRLSPSYYIAHVNLAVALRELGELDRAAQHFDRAVECEQFTATSRYWRGEFLLARGEYARARDDFAVTLELGNEPYRSHKGLATALAGLADGPGALAQTERLLALDRARTELDIVAIATPFFTERPQREAGVEFFSALRERLPDVWWVHENLGRLLLQVDRGEEGAAALAESRRLQGLADG